MSFISGEMKDPGTEVGRGFVFRFPVQIQSRKALTLIVEECKYILLIMNLEFNLWFSLVCNAKKGINPGELLQIIQSNPNNSNFYSTGPSPLITVPFPRDLIPPFKSF